MKHYFPINISIYIGIACIGLLLTYPIVVDAKGIKTSYKRFSIFKYKNQEILCEPYTVKKDDWLYKIFRKKGEISEKDFPHFLLIFKELNPQISNIDAIEPGISILIPLKKVQKKDYDLSTPVNIDVPVIEFSALPDEKLLDLFLKKHTIRRGENVSSLLDKEFLSKGGRLSEAGLKAFQLANPNIENINIVYENQEIYLPDPSIKKAPWFQSFLAGRSPEKKGLSPSSAKINPLPDPSQQIDELRLLQLKKYAALIGGTLMSKGKMYFPGAEDNLALDLARTPVIETKAGSKILIMSGVNQNEMLLERVQAYWKDIRIQAMSETIEKLKDAVTIDKTKQTRPSKNKTVVNKKQVTHLLDQLGYDYIPDAKIGFYLNRIQLEASFGRVLRDDDTDILINFGNVYGHALNIVRNKGFEVISIYPDTSAVELSSTLFSSLGYSIWENPSFFTGEAVETIIGVYAVKQNSKWFIPEQSLTHTALEYLASESVEILSLDPDHQKDMKTQ
jgi:hypothetical protein